MRMTLSKLVFCMAVFGVLLVAVQDVRADNFSFTGNFQQDDDVQTFNFNVGATSLVTLVAYSYAGSADQTLFGAPGFGTNSAGTTIARGGFDTILALFDSTGALIAQNDDGGSPAVPADIVTGTNWDTFLEVSLDAGSYTVSIMEYNNFANGPNLSDGFSRTGEGNFAGSFIDNTGDQRDSHWAFDVLNVELATAAVPEPSSFVLLGLGGIGLAIGAYRKRRLAA